MSRRRSLSPPPLSSRRKKDDISTKFSAAGSTKGTQAQVPPPLPPRRKRRDETPTPSDAGSTRAGRARDPAVAAARAAAGKREGRLHDAPEEEPEKPPRQQHKLKETLRTNPNDTNAKKDSVFGKIKGAVFGNSDNTKDDMDAEEQQSKDDRMKEKEKGQGRSARPRDADKYRRDKEGTVRGEGSRRYRAPTVESTTSLGTNDQVHGARAGTRREHGTVHGSVRGTKGENLSERREDRRRRDRDERHQARQHHGHRAKDPDEQYHTAQEDRPPPAHGEDDEPHYTPERYFSPSELDTGMKCKNCRQPRPQCSHCFQPLQKRHVVGRVRRLDLQDITESLDDLDEGSDCEGCGQPIPLCPDCGLPSPKHQILERSKPRGKAKA